MKDLFVRKLKMYRNVLSILNARKTVWGNSISFSADVQSLNTATENINKKSGDIKDSKSISKKKKQVGEEMQAAALIVCGLGYAYASEQKDESLKEKFNFYKSDLHKGNEIDIYNRCIGISKDAEPIRDILIAHDMPADQLTILNTAADKYNELISGPRSAIRETKSLNKEMDKIFHDCDIVLDEQLDKLMLVYQKDHADFYTEFTNARLIGGWSRVKKGKKGKNGKNGKNGEDEKGEGSEEK